MINFFSRRYTYCERLETVRFRKPEYARETKFSVKILMLSEHWRCLSASQIPGANVDEVRILHDVGEKFGASSTEYVI